MPHLAEVPPRLDPYVDVDAPVARRLGEAGHPEVRQQLARHRGHPYGVGEGRARLRVERQLGYKMAKYVMRIDAIDGIEGESTSEKSKGEIDVLSFSWGASQTGSSTGGGGVGKVQFQDIHFTSNLSKASPKRMLAVATGQHLKEVVLTGQQSGERGQEFLEIKMTDVLITSYQTGSSSGNVPVDSFSLNFAKIEFKYFPVNKDGSLGEPVSGGWNVKENVRV